MFLSKIFQNSYRLRNSTLKCDKLKINWCQIKTIKTLVGMSSSQMDSKLFEGRSDRFDGITIISDKETCPIAEFPKRLEDSLNSWRAAKKRGIWFRVHLTQSDWIPSLIKSGFKYHNARDEYVMLYLWLPTDEHCNIPVYANTLLGAGAVVVNARSQVLVVNEKYNPRPHWKLPGGYVELGENIIDAAIREVREETGISTEFHSVLSIRHSHNGMFNCSDVYAVVSLRPLTDRIEMCERELADCRWMDVEEYLSHPHVHDLNRFPVRKYFELEKSDVRIDCRYGVHEILKKPYSLYYVADGKEDDASKN